jgi:hypothetical protein
MLGRINLLYFFLAFTVGLLITYIYQPKPQVIVKFPSPINAGKIVYKNEKSDECFVFEAEKKECPIEKGLIKPQPVNLDE